MQAELSEEAHMAALNARERKEIADGKGLQSPEPAGDPMQLDESPESDATAMPPNMLSQCRSVHNFERLNCINEGTYGMVYRCAFNLGSTKPGSVQTASTCL